MLANTARASRALDDGVRDVRELTRNGDVKLDLVVVVLYLLSTTKSYRVSVHLLIQVGPKRYGFTHHNEPTLLPNLTTFVAR